MIKAKPILKNKFWIIENNGQRIGTLSKQEDKRYIVVLLVLNIFQIQKVSTVT